MWRNGRFFSLVFFLCSMSTSRNDEDMHFISHLLCADDMNSTIKWNKNVNLVPNAPQTSIEAKYIPMGPNIYHLSFLNNSKYVINDKRRAVNSMGCNERHETEQNYKAC